MLYQRGSRPTTDSRNKKAFCILDLKWERHSGELPEDIWIVCSSESVSSIGLQLALEGQSRVWTSREPPKDVELSCIIFLHSGSIKQLPGRMVRLREFGLKAPVIVFGPQLDLPMAHASLEAGARGFIHASMEPDQVRRAVELAIDGELVVPRKLLEYIVGDKDSADMDLLSIRQREILSLVVEGLSNAEIARRLYLSESTIKQHLRSAYKLLGVSNRTEAAARARKSI